MKVIKFAYYDEFSCIGGACPDSCCKDWGILLTKREYLDYKKAECSSELKAVIDNAFVRTRDSNELRYAAMKLRENGDCPFWGEDHLCMLQKELGEEGLCTTCGIFPRLITQVGNDALIYSCSITCCHAAELLVKHSEGLVLAEEEYDGKNRYVNKGLFSGGCVSRSWSGYPYFWAIKNAQLDILQNRSFTIPERMLILGYFCKKADEYARKEPEKLTGFADMFLDNELCRSIADSLKTSQSESGAMEKSVDILAKMLNHVQTGNFSCLIKQLFEKAANSIDLSIAPKADNGLSVAWSPERYFRNLEIYRQIENTRPYIIENILVNLVFPQTPDKGIWANYFALTVFYNTLKVCIPAFLEENYSDGDLAAAITYSAKMVVNSKIAERGTLVDFIDHQAYDLPHAAFLIS